MSIENHHKTRLARLESILQNEELATKEDLKKVEKNSLADELKAKDKLLTKTIRRLALFIVTSVYIYFIFKILGGPSSPALMRCTYRLSKGTHSRRQPLRSTN